MDNMRTTDLALHLALVDARYRQLVHSSATREELLDLLENSELRSAQEFHSQFESLDRTRASVLAELKRFCIQAVAEVSVLFEALSADEVGRYQELVRASPGWLVHGEIWRLFVRLAPEADASQNTGEGLILLQSVDPDYVRFRLCDAISDLASGTGNRWLCCPVSGDYLTCTGGWQSATKWVCPRCDWTRRFAEEDSV